jgi:hypothetical protein
VAKTAGSELLIKKALFGKEDPEPVPSISHPHTTVP